MEYMASGTPVLLTDIPSLPEEYKEYVYIAKDNKAETLSEEICKIKEAREESTKKAYLARNFILEKKNEKIQALRLIEFLQK